MDLNMWGVDVRELMCEMYCGVMVWFTRVDGVGGVAFQLKVQEAMVCTNRARGHPEGVNHVGSFKASYQVINCAFPSSMWETCELF